MNRKDLHEGFDESIRLVSATLQQLLNAKEAAKGEKHVSFVSSPLATAMDFTNSLKKQLKSIKESINISLPKPPVRPTGLTVSAENLVAFDKKYFSYFDPEDVEHNYFYKRQIKDRNALLCHLATWAFDYNSNRAALKEIRHSFGDGVAEEIKVKLRNRDHDT